MEEYIGGVGFVRPEKRVWPLEGREGEGLREGKGVEGRSEGRVPREER